MEIRIYRLRISALLISRTTSRATLKSTRGELTVISFTETFNYLRQPDYVIVVVCLPVCLSVCLIATLRKSFWTVLHDIFREGWQYLLSILISHCTCMYAVMVCVCQILLKKLLSYLLKEPMNKWLNFGWCDPHHGSGSRPGKTCVGGGMHCPNASTLIWFTFSLM